MKKLFNKTHPVYIFLVLLVSCKTKMTRSRQDKCTNLRKGEVVLAGRPINNLDP
jgi:hypothetical protein